MENRGAPAFSPVGLRCSWGISRISIKVSSCAFADEREGLDGGLRRSGYMKQDRFEPDVTRDHRITWRTLREITFGAQDVLTSRLKA